GNKVEPAVAAARARLEAGRALADALRVRVQAEVVASAAQLRTEQRLVEIQERLVPLAKQALSSAISGYAAGRVGLLTVLDSEREALMQQLELVRHVALREQ